MESLELERPGAQKMHAISDCCGEGMGVTHLSRDKAGNLDPVRDHRSALQDLLALSLLALRIFANTCACVNNTACRELTANQNALGHKVAKPKKWKKQNAKGLSLLLGQKVPPTLRWRSSSCIATLLTQRVLPVQEVMRAAYEAVLRL